LSQWIANFLWLPARFDLFCLGCGAGTTFARKGDSDTLNAFLYGGGMRLPGRDFNMDTYESLFICSRDPFHALHLQIGVERKPGAIQKTGQYPSLADIGHDELSKYTSVVPKDILGELKRGVGLFSHGIGIGSIVYLRRTLEWFVATAIDEAKAAGIEVPDASRMDEKIRLTADFLPDFLVENRAMYGMLSSGVHSLDEDHCKAMFNPCIEGLKLCLDQRLEQKNRANRIARAKSQLQASQTFINEALKKE